MKVFLHFSKSIYNCDVIIKDSVRTQSYFVNLAEAEQENSELLEIEVENGDFELTVIPKMADYKSVLSDIEAVDWKEKLAKKVGDSLLSYVDNGMLRVGCVYKVSGLKDNDTVNLRGQEYVFGIYDKFDFFELLPMMYMFFEASCNGCRFELSNAFGMNREEVISSSRKFALIDFGLHLIFTYPIQVGRIKRLTSNKKIKKTLVCFSQMSEAQRQKFLEKKSKFLG